MSLPTAPWLSSYRREWLRDDAMAGITTSAVVIPKAMAYAVVAGLAVESGLYVALAAMLVYPLLGTSRPLSVTTTSAIAMMTAAQIAASAGQLPATSPASIAATLALLVGGILIAARLLRLGVLANFISKPVLIGFEAGIGVVIIASQVKSLLGVQMTSKTTLGMLFELPAALPQAHALTALVSCAGIAMLVLMARFVPKVSAPLALVALAILASAVFGLDALGVKTVGLVPSGLPSLALPDVSLVPQLLPAALGIALMSFTESVAAARAFCQRDDPPVDANRELLAVGAANLAAAVAGGMPAGGGTSQTAIADKAGARSQMAQWINAAVVLITLLLLSPVIALLPQAALSALIAVAAVGMIKPATFAAIARIRRLELTWALATLAGVIAIGTLEGILIAVVISVLTLMYQANHPPVYAVAWNRAESIFRRAGDDPANETFPGLLLLRTEGRLTFANAATVQEKMRALVQASQPKVVVLECSAIPDIEYTALLMLIEAEQSLGARGVSLWLAAVNPDLRQRIERSALGAALGRERMFFNLRKALEAWQQGGPHGPARIVKMTLDRDPHARPAGESERAT